MVIAMKKIFGTLFFVIVFSSALFLTASADIDNLALNKKVSVNNPAVSAEYGIEKICDGSSLSRYTAKNPTEGQYAPTYITFDFEETLEYDTVDIREYLANITDFKLEYSSDGENWTLIKARTKNAKNDTAVERITFDAVQSRYLRLCVNASEGNISIYEIVLRLNNEKVPVSRGKNVTESIFNEWAYVHGPEKMLDGDTTSRWANPILPTEKEPHILTVDLENEEKINYYFIQEHIPRMLDFKIEYSLDGTSWETAVHKEYADANRSKYIEGEFDEITARYMRIVIPKSTDECSIHELEFKYAEDKPEVGNVSIKHANAASSKLVGTYKYSHPAKKAEGKSIYKWYRSDSEYGGYTLISGADQSTYTLTKDDCEKYIKFEVTPVTGETNSTGDAVMSAPIKAPNQILIGKIVLADGMNEGFINKERKEIKDGDYKCKVFTENGVIYVPLRFIAEAKGAEVGYKDGSVTVLYNGITKYITDYITLRDTAFVSTERIKEILHTSVYTNADGLVIIGDSVKNCYSDEIITEITNCLRYYGDTETLKTTAQSLFALMDFSDKSLSQIKSEYESGNYGKAMELYKDRFIEKAMKKYAPDMIGWVMHTTTEDIMNNIVQMNHPSGYCKASIGTPGSIPWFSMPPEEQNGWWVNLSSMHFPYNYVNAFLEKGETAYMKRWALVWDDFARNNYDAWIETLNSSDSQYHGSIEATYQPPLHMSWKLGNFVSQIGAAARYSPQNTKASVPGLYLADIIVRTIDYIDNSVAGSSVNATPNQVIEAGISLVTANSFLEDFTPCKKYYNDGTDIISTYLSLQYLPDGSDFEQSFNYNEALLEKAREFKKMYAADSVKPEFYGKLDEIIDYRNRMLRTLRYPDGTGPSLRNGDIGYKSTYDQMEKTFKTAVNGSENSTLDFNSIQYPYGGFYSLRTLWADENAVNMFMKASRKGSGHFDESGNSLQLWAYGRELLADSGQSSYSTDFFEDYILSSFGANTVSVDGYSQTMAAEPEPTETYTEPIAARWLNTDKFDFTEGFYTYGYGITGDWSKKKRLINDVTHDRQVIFDREDEIFISTDLLKTANKHDYTQVWGFSPVFTEDKFMLVRSQNALKTKDAGGANISVYNFNNEQLDYETYYGVNEDGGKTVYGWQTAHNLGQLKKIDAHVKWSGTGNQLSVSLLAPSKDLTEKVVSSQKLTLSDSSLTGFTANLVSGAKITYIASKNGKRQITAEGFAVNAEGIYIKESKDGKITGIILNADSAEYNGKKTSETAKSYQFEIENGEIIMAVEAKIPEGFRWETNENGNNVPVYTK